MLTYLKNHAHWLQVPVVALVILWIYQPVWHGGWLWNDDTEITSNTVAQSPAGLWTAWFTPGTLAGYAPAASEVRWVQWHILGTATTGYHFTNLALHLTAALLVWWLLGKFGLKFAWLGALIFAVHPVQVESVAWIAQMKTLLAASFYLAAGGFYISYEQRRRMTDYLLALALFAASMLTSPAGVMFPVVILLYAWWKRGRIAAGDARAVAPFFLVAFVIAVTVALLGGGDQTLHGPAPGPGGLLSWFALSGASLAFYFRQALAPSDLMPIYPRWMVDPPPLADFLPWLVLTGLGYWFWAARRMWERHVLLGVGFFVINLAPFVFTRTGGFSEFTWVMDPVLYLPIVGWVGLLVAAIEKLEAPLPLPLRIAGVALVGVGLAWMAWQGRCYAAIFSNEGTLWAYSLEKNPEAWPAQANFGHMLLRQGRMAEAVDHLQQAVRLNSNSPELRDDLGNALLHQDRISESVEQFQAALQLVPNDAHAQADWGAALIRAGQIPNAIEHIQEALRLDPDCAEAHDDWAQALLQSGQDEEAIAQDGEAVRLKPDDAQAQLNWARALAHLGRLWEAMSHDEEAVRLRPDLAEAQADWGDALVLAGQTDDAVFHYREAVRLRPDAADYHLDLGKALAAVGKGTEATAQFEEALRLNPNLNAAQDAWGLLVLKQGGTTEAVLHFQAALRLKPNDAEAHDGWGNVLAGQGKNPDAIAHFQAAVQANPDFAPAQFDWANLLFNSGSVEDSIPHYLEVVRIDPNDADAHFKAGTALAKDDQKSDALDQFEAALKLKPSAEAYDSAGLLLLRMDRKPEAVQHFQAALQLNPNDATAQSNVPPPAPPAAPSVHASAR